MGRLLDRVPWWLPVLGLLGSLGVAAACRNEAPGPPARVGDQRPAPAQVEPGEWVITAAMVDPSAPGLEKLQIATLAATDMAIGIDAQGDWLWLGVYCINDIVDQVAIGYRNENTTWVYGHLYLSIDGGLARSNWSQSRGGDGYAWRGHEDELQLLDGPQLLSRLAGSTRLVVEARAFLDTPITAASATFDGSRLQATLKQMGCRIP